MHWWCAWPVPSPRPPNTSSGPIGCASWAIKLFDRTKAAGVLRPGLTFVDIGLLLEMVSSARLGDAKRTAEMRRRYLDVIIAGTLPSAGRLPGKAPTWAEQAARWFTTTP